VQTSLEFGAAALLLTGWLDYRSSAAGSALAVLATLIFFFNHTAFELNSLWHVGYLLDDFYGFDMCSRVNLQLYNSARCPALIQGATAFGLNALLLVLTGGHNHWPSSPFLSIVPLSFSCYRLDDSIVEIVHCLVHTNSSRTCQSRLEMSPRETSFLLCILPTLRRKVEAACILAFVLTRGACCAYPCPAAGRAHRTLALCILSGVTHLNS